VRAKAATVPWLVSEDESLRRFLNIAVAAVGIVLTTPLLLLIAIAIKLTSKGPVIYTQPRVGMDRRFDQGRGPQDPRRRQDLGGRIFTIYKFRTMKARPASAKQVWAGSSDPRITSVGKLLRRTRLDELPQLFNVLKGDMNIVGPRPEQPEIFQNLQQEVGRYRHRQRVLPGITGLAQVTLPYDQSVDDVRKKVNLDLEYIRDRSAAKDLMIMAKTMPVMVFRKGSM
jgi:lipopolysaccharide/colanic/teichoic acid biosynthesis glycosyltransferase